MNNQSGKIKNKEFLDNLEAQLEQIYKDARSNSAQMAGNLIDIDGNGTMIKDEDEERYRHIVELISYLENPNLIPTETFVIPGVKITENGQEKIVELFIPKNDAHKIAAKGQEFERLLGVKFPAQLYQTDNKYNTRKVPDYNIVIPRPRYMSETEEEYETFLENHYSLHGVHKEMLPNSTIRKPYPHEMVDYRVSHEKSDTFQSEYYQNLALTQARRAINPNLNPAPPQNPLGATPQVIRESDDYTATPLRHKIGTIFNIGGTSLSSEDNHKKLKTAALVVGGGAASIFLLTNPLTHSVAVAALGLGGLAFVGTKLYKFGQSFGGRVRDFFYGKKIQPQPTTPPTPQTSPQGGQNQPPVQPPQQQGDNNQPSQPQPQPVPIPEPSVISDRLEEFLNQIGYDISEYRDLENRIAIANSELINLEIGSDLYRAKEAELQSLRQNQSTQLKIITAYTKDLFENLSKNGGGKVL